MLVGAVLSLLDGPTGCDPAFCVVWFRFRFLRRFLALWPTEAGRVYRLLGPIHSLSASAAEVGFRWAPLRMGWSRPGLPLLSNLAGKVAADLCGREGFRGGALLDVLGSLQLLNSSHVQERHKALLRWVMVGGVWNVFFRVGSGVSLFHVGSVVLQMVMVTFSVKLPYVRGLCIATGQYSSLCVSAVVFNPRR